MPPALHSKLLKKSLQYTFRGSFWSSSWIQYSNLLTQRTTYGPMQSGSLFEALHIYCNLSFSRPLSNSENPSTTVQSSYECFPFISLSFSLLHVGSAHRINNSQKQKQCSALTKHTDSIKYYEFQAIWSAPVPYITVQYSITANQKLYLTSLQGWFWF